MTFLKFNLRFSEIHVIICAPPLENWLRSSTGSWNMCMYRYVGAVTCYHTGPMFLLLPSFCLAVLILHRFMVLMLEILLRFVVDFTGVCLLQRHLMFVFIWYASVFKHHTAVWISNQYTTAAFRMTSMWMWVCSFQCAGAFVSPFDSSRFSCTVGAVSMLFGET